MYHKTVLLKKNRYILTIITGPDFLINVDIQADANER